MHPILPLTVAGFALAAVGTAAANRSVSPEERRRRWTKWAVYLVVVHLVIASILAASGWFLGLAAAVTTMGGFELHRALKRPAHLSALARSLVLTGYGLAAIGFLSFAGRSRTESILFVYAVVLFFDGFSQVTGQLIGRHPLAPRLSPAKTIEGVIGGLAMAHLAALWLGHPVEGGFRSTRFLVLFVSAAALSGDLLASSVKRACGIKDFGTWIPGHGGILDRFDSFIAAGCALGAFADLLV